MSAVVNVNDEVLAKASQNQLKYIKIIIDSDNFKKQIISLQQLLLFLNTNDIWKLEFLTMVLIDEKYDRRLGEEEIKFLLSTKSAVQLQSMYDFFGSEFYLSGSVSLTNMGALLSIPDDAFPSFLGVIPSLFSATNVVQKNGGFFHKR